MSKKLPSPDTEGHRGPAAGSALPDQESGRSEPTVIRPPNLSEEIELSLRQEIRTTQTAQSELMKWKLIAVAAIGAMSLGLPEIFSLTGANEAIPNWELRFQLLFLIPLICLYVDLVCLHYMLRIITIGAFVMKTYKEFRKVAFWPGFETPLLDYEGFVFETRSRKNSPFNLELWAIRGSSMIINGVMMLLSVILLVDISLCGMLHVSLITASIFLISSLIGLYGTSVIYRQYIDRRSQIEGVKLAQVEQ